eukprot:TRINITY_DN64354_c0_g1_i1.p2 TRINITY_DN64354_c0_g1~~TRINITY_DN64354_c0_g1_i1.p2  ORF type:complete len:146 (+),score=28.59 TRINITY_DN64354_c0_g1_i1:109-546(+)
MSDCWAWGVQQRIARACSQEVTSFLRCCRDAGEDARELWTPEERGGDRCRASHQAAVRCIAPVLDGLDGAAQKQPCRKSYAAVAADGEDADALFKAWRCTCRPSNFKRPVEQLIAHGVAVGECRAAGAVPNTAGKGAWTAGGGGE